MPSGHKRVRLLAPFGAGLLLTISRPPQAEWHVDARPAVVLGANENDTTQLFAVVVGATRLPNGNILVGDHAAMSLHVFAPDGRKVRSFGRKGQGPGEFEYLARLWRCGDVIIGDDISNGNLQSVFSLDGTFLRGFHFAHPSATGSVYNTVCNAAGVFAHNSYANKVVAGLSRPPVSFWLTGADSGVRTVIGELPGDERWGKTVNKRLVGDSPMPLGKHTLFAVSANRVFIGLADRYEILVYDFAGKAVGKIVKNQPPFPATRADMDAVRDKDIATHPPSWEDQLRRDYAAIPTPRTLPAYASLVVDSEGLLWVQDYPRRLEKTVTWSVFTSAGTSVASVSLPTDLEVYEIGRDFVLGRYIDPDESVPQVRMYRLRRG